MNIPLDNHFSIDSDRLQWILNKNSRPYWFFTDLESLLKSYVELKMRSSKAKDIEKLLDYQEKLTERLTQVFSSISLKDLGVKKPIRKEVEEK